MKCYRLCDEVTVCIENSESESKTTHKLGFKKGTVVASLNIHGLNTHTDELRLFVRDKGIHVLGINETKLGEDFHDHLVSIDGFEIVQKDRNKLGGGVALYIGDSVNFKVIDFLPGNSLELLCIEILPKAAWPFFVISFYQPPSSKIGKFEELQDV